MNKSEAYKIVYNDLVSKDNTSLFRGNYDAVNGTPEFMHGISTVIENIAFHVGEDTQYEFDEMFTHNMVLSEKRAERTLYHKSVKYRFRKRFSKIRSFLRLIIYKVVKSVRGSLEE